MELLVENRVPTCSHPRNSALDANAHVGAQLQPTTLPVPNVRISLDKARRRDGTFEEGDDVAGIPRVDLGGLLAVVGTAHGFSRRNRY